MISVTEQLYVFLSTLYGGMIIGFIYDLYRIFRKIFRPRKLATSIEDLIFWILIGVAALFVLVVSNDGQLRLYTFFGFAAGSMLYFSTLSPYVLKLMLFIVKIVKKLAIKTLRFLLYPIRKLILAIKIQARWIKKKFGTVHVKIKRVKQLPQKCVRDMKKHAQVILKKNKD